MEARQDGQKNAVAVEKPLEAWLGKGIERWMGGGRDESRNREKYKGSLRGGQTILLSLSELATD